MAALPNVIAKPVASRTMGNAGADESKISVRKFPVLVTSKPASSVQPPATPMAQLTRRKRISRGNAHHQRLTAANCLRIRCLRTLLLYSDFVSGNCKIAKRRRELLPVIAMISPAIFLAGSLPLACFSRKRDGKWLGAGSLSQIRQLKLAGAGNFQPKGERVGHGFQTVTPAQAGVYF